MSTHAALPLYEVIELDVEHVDLGASLEDIIARIEDQAQRIAAFNSLVQSH